MKIPPVKGTRDFYPQEMAVRNWIIDGWKKVSIRNGFEEYDGPIFEHLQMYQIKSGDEIVEQLFSFKDRGDRDLAIRPEITPTLARMVNQKINSLPRPIKWFSVPRLCRAERPQKGRLREFFQWNIDIIGVDDVLADAEVIFTTVDYLREIGLSPSDIKVKISSRKLLAAFLKSLGIAEDNLLPLYAVLDKKAKIPAEVFQQMLSEKVADKAKAEQIQRFMDTTTIAQLDEHMSLPEGEIEAYKEIKNLFGILQSMGIADYCVFDPSIVRGLAYYTGVVFEVHDIKGDLRAIGGGGRYDNLLHDFGGPRIAATGMGMGDCVLEILLQERGLLQVPARQVDFFVAFAPGFSGNTACELACELRSKGFIANFSYNFNAGLSKQLKAASDSKAKKCIIIGQEYTDKGELVVKDMVTGEQKLIKRDEFLAQVETKAK